jgi:uncharacterized Zn-binding protein involved in type VI secretion
MGNPAARCGDTATTCNDPADLPVGIVIAAGTVMINKLPAAKQGDQVVGVDIHIIMIPTPGGPVPTPLPHPFSGMLDSALSSSVKIMGMPAATVNSMASNMPPHIPQGGPFQKPPMNKAKIIVGSPDVFIGNGGGGGGSGGGGGAGGAAATAAAAEAKEGHYLDVKVVDSGGKPVTGAKYSIKGPDGSKSEGHVTGSIERKGVKEGSHEIVISAITKAAWSAREAAVGDKVKMEVETVGIESGEKAILQIFVKDSNFADHPFETMEAKVDSNKIEHEWELKVDQKLLDLQDHKEGKNYSNPWYYFVVETAGIKQRSGLLKYKDWIELELRDEEGNTIGGAEYEVSLPDGQVRKGKLDQNGYAKVENIPPGKVRVTFDAG